MTESKETRIKEIDLLFAWGILLVIFGHAYLAPGYEEQNPEWYKELRKFVYLFHMPLFFWLSGFLMMSTRRNRSYYEQVVRRARRLLVPYVALTIVALFPKFVLSQYTVNRPPESILTFFSGIFYPWQNVVTSYWFLPTLFLVSLLYPLLATGVELKGWYFVLPVLAVVTSLTPSGGGILNVFGVLHYLFFYTVGAACFLHQHRLNKVHPLIGALLCFSSLCVLFLFLPRELQNPLRPITAIMGIMGSYWSSRYICENLRISRPKVFDYYFQIYLLSWFVQRGCMVLNRAFDWPFLILFPLSCAGGLILPVMISKVVNTRLRSLRFIIGFQEK